MYQKLEIEFASSSQNEQGRSTQGVRSDVGLCLHSKECTLLSACMIWYANCKKVKLKYHNSVRCLLSIQFKYKLHGIVIVVVASIKYFKISYDKWLTLPRWYWVVLFLV